MCCTCNGSHCRSRDRRMNGNRPEDLYYRSHLKSDQCIDPEVIADSQYNAGNSRFAEHEYSYIADLHPPPPPPPPISTSGPDFGPTGYAVGEGGQTVGEFDWSGQARPCRPVVDCGGIKQVLRQRSAVQLVHDRPQPQSTPALVGSVVSLTDATTIAVRGVAPPSRGTVAPPPAAKQDIAGGPRICAGTSSAYPFRGGHLDSLGNTGNH